MKNAGGSALYESFVRKLGVYMPLADCGYPSAPSCLHYNPTHYFPLASLTSYGRQRRRFHWRLGQKLSKARWGDRSVLAKQPGTVRLLRGHPHAERRIRAGTANKQACIRQVRAHTNIRIFAVLDDTGVNVL